MTRNKRKSQLQIHGPTSLRTSRNEIKAEDVDVDPGQYALYNDDKYSLAVNERVQHGPPITNAEYAQLDNTAHETKVDDLDTSSLGKRRKDSIPYGQVVKKRWTEFTAPGHNFLGPGNELEDRQPTNYNDAVAQIHDKQYGELERAGYWPKLEYNDADEMAIAAWDDTGYGPLSKTVFKTKKKLAEFGILNDIRSKKKRHYKHKQPEYSTPPLRPRIVAAGAPVMSPIQESDKTT